VNLDLIYGLPYQTPDTWKQHAGADPRHPPDRTGGLRLRLRALGEAAPAAPARGGAPQDPPSAWPSSSRRSRPSPRNGYRLIGLDHFALDSDEMARAQDAGVLTRNFQGYTVRPADDTIAFGITSISDLGGAYARTPTACEDWAEKVEAGILPVVKGASVTRRRRHAAPRDQPGRCACSGSTCARSRRSSAGRPGAEIEASMKAGLPELVADGLVTFDGDVLRGHPGRTAPRPQRGDDVRRLPAAARPGQEADLLPDRLAG